MTYIRQPGEDQEGVRRRMIRDAHRGVARSQADRAGTPRAMALEGADRALRNGCIHDAAVQRTFADDLIPPHLQWAFDADFESDD